MVAGRILGWVLIAVALLLASGDAVLALGPGDHAGIMTGDIWMLLAGRAALPGPMPESIGAMLLSWPAWAAIGPAGIALVAICRPRRRRFRFRRPA